MRLLYVLLFSLLFSLSGTAQKRERKMYVMCVGVGDYVHPTIQDLTKPTCDADTVASLFAHGDNEVLVLKDSEATGDNIRRQMEKFFAKVTKHDVMIFFFSGHGITTGFCAHDYFMATDGRLSYDDIKKVFSSKIAYGKIIMADACFSGKIRTKPDTTVVPVRNNKQQVMLFLSSRGSEVSYESPTMTNGYFTTYLAEGLRGAADTNKNGKVTAFEISRYVSKKLRTALGDRQHSVMWGNFNDGWILSKVKLPEQPVATENQ